MTQGGDGHKAQKGVKREEIAGSGLPGLGIVQLTSKSK
jgi:hypothetical protein